MRKLNSMYKSTILSISSYLIFAAFFQLPEIMQYDSKRILQLSVFTILGLLFLISLINDFKNNQSMPSNGCSNKLYIVIAIVFVILFSGLISLINASNLKYALIDYTLFFVLLILAFSLAPRTLKTHYILGRFIFITAVLFASIYTLLFFGNYISYFTNPLIPLWPEKYLYVDNFKFEAREVLYFDHKRFFNHIQTWSLPILLALLTFYKKIKKGKGILILLTLLISFWWMLIFAAGARGTLVSVFCSLLVLIVAFKKDTVQLFKNGITTFFSGGIFYFVLFKLIPTDSTSIPVLRSTDSGRFEMWERALELWAQNPIFGVGPMHYAKIIGGEPYFGAPHNYYLQFLSEWGIVAFLAFIALLISFFIMIKKNYLSLKKNIPNRTIFVAFTWSITSAFIHSFFSGVFNTPMSQMWLVLMLAWFIGYKRNEIKCLVNNCKFDYLKLAFILFTTILVSLVYDDIINISTSYSEYLNTYPDSIFNPRFWVQGLFE